MIIVPVGGIDEHTLTLLTGLGWRAMYPLFGDLLVHPRDYRYHGPTGTHFLTATGVRSLVAHFRLDFEVIDSATTPMGLSALQPKHAAGDGIRDAIPPAASVS
jgi:hypothetical protein